MTAKRIEGQFSVLEAQAMVGFIEKQAATQAEGQRTLGAIRDNIAARLNLPPESIELSTHGFTYTEPENVTPITVATEASPQEA